ncbi:50S ribosomal protein L22 [Salmonella enterica subsp. arizonae]|uniref:Large ribosomal subunit protein uL22 n=1 Tax=Salmonella enterica subsp. arizonae TaxID=59203 RepID=A0A379SNK9_SALER|nr:50S ribosomal protein L22 [Salmonella enterica subsp. arizonae]
METLAQHRHARSSAQKVRLVADLIRGKESVAGSGYSDLHQQESGCTGQKKFWNLPLLTLNTNDGADIDDLKVTKIFVDEGPSMKRIMPRAKGRADRILKRTSHITVVVSDR